MKRLFLSFLLLYSSFTAIQAQEPDLSRGLVSRYTFDQNTDDTVGTNNGINHGVAFESGRCGGKVARFNGLEDYIDCGNDRSLNGNWSGLTMSVWVRPGEVSEMQLATIMAKWAFNTEKDHFGLWLNSSHKVIMAVSSPGTMENGIFSKASLSQDNWHHIAGSWRRNGEIRIYIDGQLDRIGKQTGKFINVRSTESLKIGRQVKGRSRPYKGWMDDLRLYKRALYDQEVKLLYLQGKAACEKIYVKGKVLNKNTLQPVQGEVVFEDMYDGSIFSRIETKGTNAEYELILPIGRRFGLYADVEDYLAENQLLSTEKRVLNEVIERDLFVVPVEIGQSVRLNNIFFDFAKATLREDSFHELNRILPLFDKFPNLVIGLSGHTDDVGSDEANQKLSEERANSVRSYLNSKGIDLAKIQAKGFGESLPVASNETDEGRQLNRRVEFVIVEK